jgi:hypothetical protein
MGCSRIGLDVVPLRGHRRLLVGWVNIVLGTGLVVPSVRWTEGFTIVSWSADYEDILPC